MAVDHLALEFQALRGIPLEAHVAVLRHLLAVLVLRLSQRTAAVGSPAPEPGETFVHVREAVERDFTLDAPWRTTPRLWATRPAPFPGPHSPAQGWERRSSSIDG